MLRGYWTAVAVAAMASAAVAADAPATSRPGWNREAFQQMRAQHERQMADDIALLIGITPAQRPALDSFLQTMRPPHGPDAKDHHGDATPPGTEQPQTMLQRLDRMSQMIDRHDEQAKQRIAAARAFYTGLTPQQQQRFDALERLRHGPMGGPGHRGMHGMHGMGDHRGPGGPGGPGPDGAPPPPPPAD